MNTLKSLRLIINLQTLVVTGLSILATYLCIHSGIVMDFPLTLIGIAIVFPVVFSISEAYKRREKALGFYGDLKANGRAIYFASRDWIGDNSDEHNRQKIDLLNSLFVGCRELFYSENKQEEHAKEEFIYKQFSELSQSIVKFRKRGLSNGEVSRSNQYLSKMIIAFEKIKHIYQYRTPRTLRVYSKVFIYVLPIVYGPYFAYIAGESSTQWLWFVMPLLFSVIFVSLDNIQDHLENPFDKVGEDDIIINAEKFTDRLSL